jgi:hypothetical protein
MIIKWYRSRIEKDDEMDDDSTSKLVAASSSTSTSISHTLLYSSHDSTTSLDASTLDPPLLLPLPLLFLPVFQLSNRMLQTLHNLSTSFSSALSHSEAINTRVIFLERPPFSRLRDDHFPLLPPEEPPFHPAHLPEALRPVLRRCCASRQPDLSHVVLFLRRPPLCFLSQLSSSTAASPALPSRQCPVLPGGGRVGGQFLPLPALLPP